MNEANSFVLGGSLELINNILTNKINNGVGFINKINEQTSKVLSIEAVLAKYCIQKHNMKRVLILNWDKDHNLNLQNEFYNNSK